MPLNRSVSFSVPPSPGCRVISESALGPNSAVPLVKETEVAVRQAVMEGKSIGKAVVAAGLQLDKSVAKAYGARVIERYNEDLQTALRERGITVEKLADVLADQLHAKRYVLTKADGIVPVPDNQAIQGAVDKVLDILPGARAPKRMEVETRTLEAVIMRIQHEDNDDDE